MGRVSKIDFKIWRRQTKCVDISVVKSKVRHRFEFYIFINYTLNFRFFQKTISISNIS